MNSQRTDKIKEIRTENTDQLGASGKINLYFPLSGNNLLGVGMYDHTETCPALCARSDLRKQR